MTAPASDSLARNLANDANGEETVHAEHMGYEAAPRQGSPEMPFHVCKARGGPGIVTIP